MRLLVGSISLLLTAVAFAGTGKAYPPSDVEAQYSVVEVEILSALGEAGRRYRVVQIHSRQMYDQFPEELRFEGEKKPIGFGGFGSSSGVPELLESKTGDWRTGESTMLVLSSIYSPSAPLEIHGLAGKSVAFRARLLKRCPIRVKLVESKELRGTGSGVIAIPKIVVTKHTEVSRPACFEETDRVFVAGYVSKGASREVVTRVERARVESDLEETKRARAIDRERLSEGFLNEMRGQVSQLASKFVGPDGVDFESRIKQTICPLGFAKAKVLGVERFEFEKKLLESKRENGYTRESFERILTVRRSTGEKVVFDSPRGLFDVFSIVGALTLDDARGCFAIAFRPRGGYSESKVIEEMKIGFANFLDLLLRREADRRALAQIPEP